MDALQLLKLNNEKKENFQEKRNIICLYPDYNLLKAVFDDETNFIVVLSLINLNIESDEFFELIIKNQNRIGRIVISPLSYEAFYEMFKTDYQLSIEEILLYRNAQLDYTREMARSVLPLVESDYRYFIALSFWVSVFKTYPIKFVVSGSIYHGDLFDAFAYNIARQHKIPVYYFCFQLLMENKQLVAVKRVLGAEETFLRLNAITGESKIDLNSYCFHNMGHKKAKTASPQKIKHFFGLKVLRRIQFFINNYRLSTKELFLLQTKKFKSHFTYGILEIADSLAYIKELKKIYKAICSSIDTNEKYIYFSLHLEPEAAILNSSICASQLFYIKMLSENLPAGWKVYVKDHPYQYVVQKQSLWYVFYAIKNFRPKSFYAHIINMKNVKLIDYAVPSKEVLEHASAVASINGTVNFECLLSGKPLLFFQNSMSLISQIQDLYKITNGKDVYNALLEIEKNEFKSNNFQEEKFIPYLVEFGKHNLSSFDENEEKKYKLILKQIIKDVSLFKK